VRIADDRDFRTFPRVSRDLLDSINEIYFLLRRAPLLSGEDVSVLDIGAGYGRLAHRMLTAVPNITRYYCVDAVPESTFLCDWYLRYRGLADRATVVPLDMLDRLGERRIDLAVNVRSFTEMSYPPIAAWIGLIAELGIGTLMI
jgi:putative sugar O-methyltransferase